VCGFLICSFRLNSLFCQYFSVGNSQDKVKHCMSSMSFFTFKWQILWSVWSSFNVTRGVTNLRLIVLLSCFCVIKFSAARLNKFEALSVFYTVSVTLHFVEEEKMLYLDQLKYLYPARFLFWFISWLKLILIEVWYFLNWVFILIQVYDLRWFSIKDLILKKYKVYYLVAYLHLESWRSCVKQLCSDLNPCCWMQSRLSDSR
jgi:hypothetical protein